MVSIQGFPAKAFPRSLISSTLLIQHDQDYDFKPVQDESPIILVCNSEFVLTMTLQDGGAHRRGGSQLSLFVLLYVVRSSTHITKHYSRLDLLDIGFQLKVNISGDFHRNHNIPDEIARPAGSPWIVIGLTREETKTRLQGWATAQAKETATQTSAAEPLPY
ncbi:unnamed protein product [Menidia menidia]|uniref:(Atlantic silverside) hypothetical protein n=1 Tax=Menidia menidia TaxID=238744 RepID=A0A8S4BD84_9TELE|nr:unnamed protein product [Menidia menidia]